MVEMVRRSRFITTLARAPDARAAHTFIQRIREEFPDATHNCRAFVAGPPGSTIHVGMNDDGEPRGTAGRPMLAALLHGGVGEVGRSRRATSAARSWAPGGSAGPTGAG